MVADFLKYSLLNERLARNMLGWTHSGFSPEERTVEEKLGFDFNWFVRPGLHGQAVVFLAGKDGECALSVGHAGTVARRVRLA